MYSVEMVVDFDERIDCTVKKGSRFSRPQPGEVEIDNLFLQCVQ
jgi:hypothetical protein